MSRASPLVPGLQTLKDKLTGLGKDIQASDASDLNYDTLKASL